MDIPPYPTPKKSGGEAVYLYKGFYCHTHATPNKSTLDLLTIKLYNSKIFTKSKVTTMPDQIRSIAAAFIEKYTGETDYAPSLEYVLKTVPPRKLKSDKQLIGVLQRVLLRGMQHDLSFPTIASVSCVSGFESTTINMTVITTSAGDDKNVTVEIPQILTQLESAVDPTPLYMKFAVDAITAVAKELK